MRRVFIATTLIIAALYIAVLLLAFLFQRSLIYPASQERFDPVDGYEAFTLQTEDDLSLRAFFRPAKNGQPTLVYFHGNGGTLRGGTASNALFAENDYGVLLVNYRGYGGNPVTPSEAGFYSDGRAAMNWLAAAGIGPADTIIIGNSIGSGTAVQMALEYDPRALILGAPFTSLVNVVSEKVPWLPARLLLRDRFDNAVKIGDLDLPVLIQHGTNDQLIPPEHGKTLAGKAKAATLQLFEGEGHEMIFLPETQAQRLAWVNSLTD